MDATVKRVKMAKDILWREIKSKRHNAKPMKVKKTKQSSLPYNMTKTKGEKIIASDFMVKKVLKIDFFERPFAGKATYV